ncbi:MAG: hypothetical protein WCT14_00875 [Treponemataceae bacterium]
MAMQNLVSASITPEAKADILAKIAEIRGRLDFLLSLNAEEIQSIVKVGTNYAPFLDKAYQAVNDHPEVMARMFNTEEFKKDYHLSKDLGIIVAQINQLHTSVQNTLTAVNSDAMMAALEVYAAVKKNSDKVPGLNVVSGEMGEFFKKPKRKAAAVKA